MPSHATTSPNTNLFPSTSIALAKTSALTLIVTFGLAILVLSAAILIAPGSLRSALAAAPLATQQAPQLLDEGQAGLYFRWDATSSKAVKAPPLNSEVSIEVNGPVVRARVRQLFVNPSKAWLEGVYVFPLPERSAVDRLTMTIGERRIEGRILEKAEAEKVYRQAAREGRRASLLSGKRPNVFVTSVANIGPGETIAIEIEYQDKVELKDGRFELRFPMVVAPRYTPADGLQMVSAPAAAGDETEERPTPPSAFKAESFGRDVFGPVAQPGRGPGNALLLQVRLDAGLPLDEVESLYHPVRIEELAGGAEKRITLAEGPVPADRDFILTWTPAVGGAPEATLAAEQLAGDSYLLVSLLPPSLAEGELARPARDLTFIIDTSGSMHGASLAQAKAAVLEALDRLQPGDRFNVIQFNSETHGLYSGLRPADDASLRRAGAYVGALVAEGGTRMRPALLRALNESADPDRLRQIVFLTDGAVSNESQLFDLIAGMLGEARLFTVGIGSAPNSHFMRRAAELGRGSFLHIGDTGEVDSQMRALFRKLESPMLTHVRIDWPAGAGPDPETYPDPIPDLYAGEPVTFTARLPGQVLDGLSGEIEISGRQGEDLWSRRLDLSGLTSAPGVAAVWARSKIVGIKDRRYQGAAAAEIRRDLVQVALAHQLVTTHTSLVAVDEEVARPETAPLASAEVPRNLPQGWSFEKVFGEAAGDLQRIELPASLLRRASAKPGQPLAGLPQTATAAELKALIGLLLATLGGLLLLIVCRGLRRRSPGLGG